MICAVLVSRACQILSCSFTVNVHVIKPPSGCVPFVSEVFDTNTGDDPPIVAFFLWIILPVLQHLGVRFETMSSWTQSFWSLVRSLYYRFFRCLKKSPTGACFYFWGTTQYERSHRTFSNLDMLFCIRNWPPTQKFRRPTVLVIEKNDFDFFNADISKNREIGVWNFRKKNNKSYSTAPRSNFFS